ncbi:hypothetical protein C791_8351 [Amycolatopsis azurea DSM 43854]|uniref:Uncharacterized protein n=1 Tax=Amycolatopsis azurea DSM 43854 TaxID=1238180 RepID=M2NK34_9PSEU|nr:hypothetical protein C791_8351 [Amycolatopsis azurea DSM 43854]
MPTRLCARPRSHRQGVRWHRRCGTRCGRPAAAIAGPAGQHALLGLVGRGVLRSHRSAPLSDR